MNERSHVDSAEKREGLLRIVSWNMGCAPPMARYRKIHAEAWRYLLGELRPDIAFVQEALLAAAPEATLGGQIYWSEDHGSSSGTGIWVRIGLEVRALSLRSAGSYVAAVELLRPTHPLLAISAHVGGPAYRKHLQALADTLSTAVANRPFIAGGDLNAARHLDDVQGGRWFTRYFDDLTTRGFVDCHWTRHGKEVQSFWGPQAQNEYQCDHFLADGKTDASVTTCRVVDNADVRRLSDHGPILLELRES